MKFLKCLAFILPSLLLASCGSSNTSSKEPYVETLDDLDSAHVLGHLHLGVDEVENYELTTSINRVNQLTTDTSNYIEKQVYSDYGYKAFFNDESKSLTVYIPIEQPVLKQSFFSSFTKDDAVLKTITFDTYNGFYPFLTDDGYAEINLFSNLKSLQEVDFSYFNFRNTSSFEGMFKNTPSLKLVNFSSINKTNVNDFKYMFESTGLYSTKNILGLSNFYKSDLTGFFKNSKNIIELDLNFLDFYYYPSNLSSFLEGVGTNHTIVTLPNYAIQSNYYRIPNFHPHPATEEEVNKSSGAFNLNDPIINFINDYNYDDVYILARDIFKNTPEHVVKQFPDTFKSFKSKDVVDNLYIMQNYEIYGVFFFNDINSFNKRFNIDSNNTIRFLPYTKQEFTIGVSLDEILLQYTIYICTNKKLDEFTIDLISSYKNLLSIQFYGDLATDNFQFDNNFFQTHKDTLTYVLFSNNFSFHNMTSLANLFKDCTLLTRAVFMALMPNITDISGMLENTNVQNTDHLFLSTVKPKIEKYDRLFAYCPLYNIDLTKFDFTSALSVNSMFEGVTTNITNVKRSTEIDFTTLTKATSENKSDWNKPSSLVREGDMFVKAKRSSVGTLDFPVSAIDVFKNASESIINALTK